MKRLSAEMWLLISIALVAIGIGTLTGCESTSHATPSQRESYLDEIAIIAGELSDDSQPNPNPVPTPVNDTCPTCRGKGKVGDGTIFVTCKDCDGTGKRKTNDAKTIQELTEKNASLQDEITKLEVSVAYLTNKFSPEKEGTCRCGPDCQCDKSEVLDVRNYANGRYLKVNLEGQEVWLWQQKEVVTTPKKIEKSVLAPPVMQGNCTNGQCEVPMRRGLLGRRK